MCTFLGAARGLRVPDMDDALLTGAKVTYVEGYLWDEVNAHEALLHAIHREWEQEAAEEAEERRQRLAYEARQEAARAAVMDQAFIDNCSQVAGQGGFSHAFGADQDNPALEIRAHLGRQGLGNKHFGGT